MTWRGHTSDPDAFPRRLWRSDWSGDQFEIIQTQAEFDEIARVAQRFGIPIREAEDNGQ
jgi:hypothetical protein